MTMDPTHFFHGRQLEIARAIDVGDTDSLRTLIFAEDLNQPAGEGMTLLIYALARRQRAAMKLLLEGGANPNALTPQGATALHLAAGADDPALLETFLGKADPNLPDGNGKPPSFIAAEQRRWENLKLLLDHGASIDAADRDGNTLLHMLAMRNNFEAVAVLLRIGANPNIRNHNRLLVLDVVRNSPAMPDSAAGQWREQVLRMLAAGPPVQSNG